MGAGFDSVDNKEVGECLVLFFSCFSILLYVLLYIQVVIHFMVILGQRRQQEEPKRRWALVECFFFLVFF